MTLTESIPRLHLVPTFAASPRDLACLWQRRLLVTGANAWPHWPAADPSRRTFVRLIGAADHEAWLIRWPVGASVGLHDHGGAPGAAIVIRGSLHERVRSRAGEIGALRHWRPGHVQSFGAGHVHEVWNEGREPTFSVHVYAPRLESMQFYAIGARGRLVPKERWTGENS